MYPGHFHGERREQPLLRTYYVLLHRYANFTVTLGLAGVGGGWGRDWYSGHNAHLVLLDPYKEDSETQAKYPKTLLTEPS